MNDMRNKLIARAEAAYDAGELVLAGAIVMLAIMKQEEEEWARYNYLLNLWVWVKEGKL